jgi:monoamine oxidase
MENQNAVLQTKLERDPVKGTFQLLSFKEGPEGRVEIGKTPVKFGRKSKGGHVLIIGGGVSGLTAAYEFLKSSSGAKYKVTIIEAAHRVGGRSLTLRHGDSFTETITTGPKKEKQVTQTCTFVTEPGAPYPAYLNAGPGRIPSYHTHVLSLCKELKVAIEVYIMESRSNRNYPPGNVANKPYINRRLANDARGYIADDLYHLLPKVDPDGRIQKYKDLLRNFGALTKEKDGTVSYKGSQRSGYIQLPGITPGVEEKPIPKNELLDTEYWNTKFYQPDDFEWQATSFQPVGGMDMIEKALLQKIIELGGTVLYNAPVQKVERTPTGFRVDYVQDGAAKSVEGNFCLCNAPIPLMNGKLKQSDYNPRFWDDFTKVATAKDFLQAACKVGWQARRDLWQNPKNEPGKPVTIPIFGGISYTNHPITQMWYPSDRMHDEWGTLTGTYNYEKNAEDFGKMDPPARLEIAREGAQQLHGEEFAKGLQKGITIAWQNIPTQKGGWVDWSKVSDKVVEQARIMNSVREGDRGFHFIGDQVSFEPGWKEGAVVVALEAFAQLSGIEGFIKPQVIQVPNTRALVQGHLY